VGETEKTYQITIPEPVQKQIGKLGHTAAKRILKKLKELKDPDVHQPPKIKRMTEPAHKGKLRLRINGWRVVYKVVGQEVVVEWAGTKDEFERLY